MKTLHNSINEGSQLRRYKKATVILSILLALSLAYGDFKATQLKDLQKVVVLSDKEQNGLHTVRFAFIDTIEIDSLDNRRYALFMDSILNKKY